MQSTQTSGAAGANKRIINQDMTVTTFLYRLRILKS